MQWLSSCNTVHWKALKTVFLKISLQLIHYSPLLALKCTSFQRKWAIYLLTLIMQARTQSSVKILSWRLKKQKMIHFRNGNPNLPWSICCYLIFIVLSYMIYIKRWGFGIHLTTEMWSVWAPGCAHGSVWEREAVIKKCCRFESF